MFLKKINTAFYFYDYCYTLIWQKTRSKTSLQFVQSGGIYFAVTCFILYVFLLAVILWRCGIHARWSAPVMLWLDMAILIYGIYLGSKKDWRSNYFRRFSVKNNQNSLFGFSIYLIILSPFLTILFTLFLAKPFIILHFR